MATRPAPAKKAPTQQASTQKAPAQKAAAQKAAAQKAPAQKAPAQKASAQKAAAQKTSGQKTPGQKAPAKQPAGAAPRKAAPAPVVTLKAVFEQLGETHELPKKQAQALLTDLVTTLTTHLKKGTKIRMSGLGTLEVRDRAARMGRNPATGEAMNIKASKKIAFRAAKELKAAI